MPSESADLVRRFCAAWADGDVGAIAAFLAPDVEWENVPIGILRGRDAAQARIAAAFAKFRTIRWDVHAIATSADGAVLTERTDVITTDRGEILLRIMGLFRVGPEGITLWRDYFDAETYARDCARGRSEVTP